MARLFYWNDNTFSCLCSLKLDSLESFRGLIKLCEKSQRNEEIFMSVFTPQWVECLGSYRNIVNIFCMNTFTQWDIHIYKEEATSQQIITCSGIHPSSFTNVRF